MCVCVVFAFCVNVKSNVNVIINFNNLEIKMWNEIFEGCIQYCQDKL